MENNRGTPFKRAGLARTPPTKSQNINYIEDTEIMHTDTQGAAKSTLKNCYIDENGIPTMYPPYLQEMQEMKEQLKKSHEQIKRLESELIYFKIMYKKDTSPTNSEEEEIVAREVPNNETAWQLPKPKQNKKRKAVESPEKEDISPSTSQSKLTRNQRPPPVIVSEVNDFPILKHELEKLEIPLQMTYINNGQVKINTEQPDHYRLITKKATTTNWKWHSYENKMDRKIRVMVKNIHPTCREEEILQDLKQKGFKIDSVTQRLKKVDGKNVRLPMFMLTFDATEDINKVFGIKFINYLKVKIAALRKSKLIPQCKKCQRYGHTRQYCHRDEICVKCAGKHDSKDCNKSRELPATCANCGDAHPANYRGCLIAKNLQNRKQERQKPTHRTFTSNTVRDGNSYANIIQNKNQAVPETNRYASEDLDIKQMMQNMMSMVEQINNRIDTLEAKITGAVPKRVHING